MSSREEPEEEEEPVFPPIVLPPAVGDTWRDHPPTNNPTIVGNPTTQVGPVWWYHADHLGSTTYITDLHGKPVQYIEYLPFTSLMFLFVLVFGALCEGKSERCVDLSNTKTNINWI